MVKAPKLEYGPKKPLTAYFLFAVDSREAIKKKNKKASRSEIVCHSASHILVYMDHPYKRHT